MIRKALISSFLLQHTVLLRSGNGSAEMFAKRMYDGLLQSYLSTGINTRTATEMRGKGSTDIKHTVKKENPLKHMAKPVSRLFTHLYLTWKINTQRWFEKCKSRPQWDATSHPLWQR